MSRHRSSRAQGPMLSTWAWSTLRRGGLRPLAAAQHPMCEALHQRSDPAMSCTASSAPTSTKPSSRRKRAYAPPSCWCCAPNKTWIPGTSPPCSIRPALSNTPSRAQQASSTPERLGRTYGNSKHRPYRRKNSGILRTGFGWCIRQLTCIIRNRQCWKICSSHYCRSGLQEQSHVTQIDLSVLQTRHRPAHLYAERDHVRATQWISRTSITFCNCKITCGNGLVPEPR